MITDDSLTSPEEAPVSSVALEGAAEHTPAAVDVVTGTPEAPALDTTPAAEEVPEMASSEAPTAPEPVIAAPAPTPEPVAAASDADLFEAAMAELAMGIPASGDPSYKKLNKGDRIEATVIQVERDRVFVDLGTKSEGVVPLAELVEGAAESAHDHVKVGDKIMVIVLRPESAEGNPIVSKKRADFEEAWQRIVDSFQDQKVLTAPVVDRVKGGLVVDIGVRGFVPATHVGSGKLRNIEKYVGQTIDLKIIEVDRDRKKVVLSNRLAEEERRENVKQTLFDKVAPGETLEGTVRRLTDYGAFVDLGGIDGLLHISEMSWMRINHPKEVLKEGQKIKVMVLRLDPAVGKISLGLRQVLPDPWNLIKENYKIGQKFACKISRLVQSGAFIKLPEGAEAFLPVSEISNRRIGKPSDVLEEGQDVELAIIDLRPDERRMVLSLRTAGGAIDPPAGTGPSGMDEYDDLRGRRTGVAAGPGGPPRGKPMGGKKGGRGRGRDDEDYDAPVIGRVPTGGATIGERLGMLRGFLGRDVEEDDTESTDSSAEKADAPEAAATVTESE